MNYINLDAKGEAIKQFFLSLPSDPEGTVVEVNGRAVARLVPILAGDNDASNGEHAWTKAKNVRRCFLIDQEIEGTLSPEEARELAAFQRQMLQHVQRIAPLPLDATSACTTTFSRRLRRHGIDDSLHPSRMPYSRRHGPQATPITRVIALGSATSSVFGACTVLSGSSGACGNV